MSSVLERDETATSRSRTAGSRLLLAGGISFAVVLAGWAVYAATHLAAYTVDPADLRVYTNGGLIVRHVRPTYDPSLQYPLYQWPLSKVALKFTYTPFAAVSFAAISLIPWSVLPRLSQVVNLLLLVTAAWFTLDGLAVRPMAKPAIVSGGRPAGASRGATLRTPWGVRRMAKPAIAPGGERGGASWWRGAAERVALVWLIGPAGAGRGEGFPVPAERERLDWRVKLGGSLLAAAVALLLEPVFRTIYLGQINLLLMAMVLIDLRLPGHRRLKGAATGVAAGIKLVPLIFIPYLVLTRRYRAAVTATAAFAATIAVGFAAVPRDSSDWWLHGLFFADGRTGFVGWGGNQSLKGMLTRFAGSINLGNVWWWLAALAVALIGLTAAALIDRAGHFMLAILTTALVGLLDSPISWDHHWVWVVPGMIAAAWYAARAWQEGRRAAARWCAGVAAGLVLVFAAWPGALWSVPITGPGDFTNGLIWAGPNSKVSTFMLFGDNPAYLEYHWRGLQNVSGNAFVLAGIALLIVLTAAALRMAQPSGEDAPPA